MLARSVSPATIVVVLLALLALTALTVGVSFVSLSPSWHLAIGLAIAVAKATLVVLFFMHVIHSPAIVRAVIVVALFWLLAVLMALTFSDYVSRNTVWFELRRPEQLHCQHLAYEVVRGQIAPQ